MGRIAGLSSAETRERLVDAAAAIFAECGFDGARTGEIARRAGLSTGAIYSQYGTKAELLVAAIRAHAPAELEALFQRDAGSASLLDLLQALGEDLPFRAAPLAGILVEAWSAGRRDRQVAKVLMATAAQRQALLAELFEAGQASGEVDPSLSAQALARFCLLLVFGSVVAQSAGLEPPGRDEWAALVARVIAAVRPDRGEAGDAMSGSRRQTFGGRAS